MLFIVCCISLPVLCSCLISVVVFMIWNVKFVIIFWQVNVGGNLKRGIQSMDTIWNAILINPNKLNICYTTDMNIVVHTM